MSRLATTLDTLDALPSALDASRIEVMSLEWQASQRPERAPSPLTGILAPHHGHTSPRSGTGGTSTPSAAMWSMTSRGVVPISSAMGPAPQSAWWATHRSTVPVQPLAPSPSLTVRVAAPASSP